MWLRPAKSQQNRTFRHACDFAEFDHAESRWTRALSRSSTPYDCAQRSHNCDFAEFSCFKFDGLKPMTLCSTTKCNEIKIQWCQLSELTCNSAHKRNYFWLLTTSWTWQAFPCTFLSTVLEHGSFLLLKKKHWVSVCFTYCASLSSVAHKITIINNFVDFAKTLRIDLDGRRIENILSDWL